MAVVCSYSRDYFQLFGDKNWTLAVIWQILVKSFGVEELTRQLTEYGERLIARGKPSAESRRRPSRDFLSSFSLPKGSTSEQLIDEHLAEKYGV